MIQRGYRALLLWVAWSAAAIVIFASLYHDTDVLNFVKNDSTRITWAILALFATGILTSFTLTVLLTLESIEVDRLEVVAKQQGWMGIDKSKKRLCINHFFNSLKTIVNNNGELNIEALVDVEFSFYSRTTHALEVIGNLLITMGLIGTVVGLTLTLTGLTSSLEALGQDQEQLLSGLRGAMGGMGTAFYTTLLGSVLGGVLLRVFAHIDENGTSSLENSLTRICLVYCSADFKPSVERDVRALNREIQNMTLQVQSLQQCLDSARQTIKDFSAELSQLNNADKDTNILDNTLKKRQLYLTSLREEFQLKRMNKGLWWRTIVKSFRKE